MNTISSLSMPLTSRCPDSPLPSLNHRICNRRCTSSLRPLARSFSPASSQSAERRVTHAGLVVRRECQLYETEEVFEDFGVALHAGAPVFVDAAFELGVGVGDFRGVRTRVVVVGGALGYAVDLRGVLFFAAGGEHAEVGEDVVLGVAADPGSAEGGG
jgi:hypothetical protein